MDQKKTLTIEEIEARFEKIKQKQDKLYDEIKKEEENQKLNPYKSFNNNIIKIHNTLLLIDLEDVQPLLLQIPTAQGARTDLMSTKITKEFFVKEKLGLSRQEVFKIEKLTPEIVDYAIKYANEHHICINRSNAISLYKKKDKEKTSSKKEQQNKEADHYYDVLYMDLPSNYNEELLSSLPIADSAVIFAWTTPNRLCETLSVIQNLGFEYKTNAIWDKVDSKKDDIIVNHHEILIIGIKNNYKIKNNNFSFDSILVERQECVFYKPDYYYSMIEKMCPKTRYLEVFSDRKYSNQWDIFNED